MSSPQIDVALPGALLDQPLERVSRDGVEYVVLGTAHVSRASVAAVEALVANEAFDAIAVELCPSRAEGMRNPDAFKQMDLFQVIRQGKVGMVAASLVLSSFQQRLAAQYGIQPGAEMKAAMDGAERANLPVWLIDREVGTTLKRAWRSVGTWARFGLLGGLIASVFEREQVDEKEIEKLKEGDLLESAFGEFAQTSAPLYDSLIGERDEYMAARLRELAQGAPAVRRVLVVIGAGHLKGLCAHLRQQQEPPARRIAELAQLPPKARWPKWLALGLVLLVFAAIAYAFHRNPTLGALALRNWVLFTGGCAALGALAAGGHPLSILAAFVAAPIKPFRPGIPAGGISAMAEAWIRRPRVADFETLRDDIGDWKGWWKNRVARTLLNFILVSAGTVIGEYAAGIQIFKSLF
ncbi:TraB/GumN family protein [Frateuria terrea]|uniref:Pheromone shutdown-related protein TraB n=1 Tax=Frateuria terrea TaxID=529704 RepID=A0A1H6UIZ2_9GAMM|nr:TraB/GumN family protein [Frateuria terrea]SEI92249.1 pheromone shutdown-related protein TraB [Frateuria terrea]SFP35427.1 pheromone shutdown-related protein TraB [Frateuria terrea]